MTRLFLTSLKRHLIWWWASIWPGKHPHAPLSLRRFAFLLLAYPLFLVGQSLHWLGFFCDELFFSDYRKVEVKAPVFITGIPRSGTTFLHRTLAVDEKQFSTVSTWEALLAPSLTQRHIIAGLARIDRLFGAPLHQFLKWVISRFSGDFKEIHEISLSAPEEDYLFLLPVGGCFILLMAFPFADTLSGLSKMDTYPPEERGHLLNFYRRMLQKHLFYHGKERTLLSKNAAFATWSNTLVEHFPDARLILCVREPAAALSSQISSLQAARDFFAIDPEGDWTAQQFAGIFSHSYTYLADFLTKAVNNRIGVLDHSDLASHPETSIQSTLNQIGLEASDQLSQHLGSLKPHSGSAHEHRLSDQHPDAVKFEHCTRTAYEAILKSSCRAQAPTTPHA